MLGGRSKDWRGPTVIHVALITPPIAYKRPLLRGGLRLDQGRELLRLSASSFVREQSFSANKNSPEFVRQFVRPRTPL